MKIVFLGTPAFAVPSLDILIESGFDIVGVITSVDKYGGRGRKRLIKSDVKKYAESKGLNILQPRNMKNQEFLEELRCLEADLQIVVAFRMMPVTVWDMPPLGTYNLHASFLPAYRGAAPINWAIINGEKKTGLTTFKLKHAIDTGDIAYQVEMPIYRNDTAGTMHDKLMIKGAELILKTVNDIKKGKIELTNQKQSKVSKAPKIFHDDCQLDFEKDVESLYNFVRGLNPYPLAWTKLLNKKLKVVWANPIVECHNFPTGEFVTDYKSFLKAACANGFLALQEVQLEGKRSMNVQEFLNGAGSKMKKESTQ